MELYEKFKKNIIEIIYSIIIIIIIAIFVLVFLSGKTTTSEGLRVKYIFSIMAMFVAFLLQIYLLSDKLTDYAKSSDLYK